MRRQQFDHLATATATVASTAIPTRIGSKVAAAAIEFGRQLDGAAGHCQLEARALLGDGGGGEGQPAERVAFRVG